MPRRYSDERGWFRETYSARSFAPALGNIVFVQDNQAFSAARGTLRGLHFQRPPEPQAKLVRVLHGSIFDVAVDIRAGSPTYGRWVGETLTADGGEQMFVPHGFAHGYCTLEPNTEVAYKVDGFYSPACDAGLAWNDTTIGIEWSIAPDEVILSDKDKKLPAFADFVSPFRYENSPALV
jgi:dTDP-4-dehydrorhamnose 3,5-epimerase